MTSPGPRYTLAAPGRDDPETKEIEKTDPPNPLVNNFISTAANGSLSIVSTPAPTSNDSDPRNSNPKTSSSASSDSIVAEPTPTHGNPDSTTSAKESVGFAGRDIEITDPMLRRLLPFAGNTPSWFTGGAGEGMQMIGFILPLSPRRNRRKRLEGSIRMDEVQKISPFFRNFYKLLPRKGDRRSLSIGLSQTVELVGGAESCRIPRLRSPLCI